MCGEDRETSTQGTPPFPEDCATRSANTADADQDRSRARLCVHHTRCGTGASASSSVLVLSRGVSGFRRALIAALQLPWRRDSTRSCGLRHPISYWHGAPEAAAFRDPTDTQFFDLPTPQPGICCQRRAIERRLPI